MYQPKRHLQRKIAGAEAMFIALACDDLRLNPLRGDRAVWWSVRASGNRRLVFLSEDGEAMDVDLFDYHCWGGERTMSESRSAGNSTPRHNLRM